MIFLYPYILLLLLLPLALLLRHVWYSLRRQHSAATADSALMVSHLNREQWRGVHSWRSRLYPHLPLLPIAAFALLVVALARPQKLYEQQKINAEGLDIVLALDVSGSMLARDFEPDRLEAMKKSAAEFVRRRTNDRIGLVVFSGEAFTQCPLTTDHHLLLQLISQLKTGILEDGTAVGKGLATAVNRLIETKAASKIIILLTDGTDTKVALSPLDAADIAAQYGIKVYTIGVGSNDEVPFPVQDIFGSTVLKNTLMPLDETVLKEIAQRCQGKYFHAQDQSALQAIYKEIDRLEKTTAEVTTLRRYSEQYRIFAIPALLLLLLFPLLKITIFRGLLERVW